MSHILLCLIAFVANKSVASTVQSLVLFVGYPRSAHTIVGSILDAHPNVAIVHEGSIVEHAHSFSNQTVLVDFIVQRAAQQHVDGRWQTGFSYAIKGAWQGQQKSPLMVVGDKKGGATSALLAADWDGTMAKIDHLRAMTAGHVKYIHVVRNVFDNIASMIMINLVGFNTSAYQQIRLNQLPRPWKSEYDTFVQRYLLLAQTNMRLSDEVMRVPNSSFLHVNGRQLLAEPFNVFQDICFFLNVPFNEQWAKMSAAKLFREPFNSRNHFAWPRETIELLLASLSKRPFTELLQLPSTIKKGNNIEVSM